jgi:hypothetical protein
MAILGILVVMMAQIFSESDKAWNNGTGRAFNNAEGRAALNMIVRDLELAVSDNILTFKMDLDRNNIATYGFTNSEINFVSLQGDSSDTNRTAREIQYWVNPDSTVTGRYQLVRSEVSTADNPNNHCYHLPTWYADRATGFSYAVIAENVVGLAFYAPDGSRYHESGAGNPSGVRTPQYVDVFLEIMNERDMKLLRELGRTGPATFNPNQQKCLDFVERNARRYTGRAYFQNRQGYLVR